MNKEQVGYMKTRILAAIDRVHLTKAERKGKTPTEIYYIRAERFAKQNPKVIELLEKETKKEKAHEVPK
jgi:hypothetical protein